jgi:CO/xanthine dehydrogenase FAD-binding subunit
MDVLHYVLPNSLAEAYQLLHEDLNNHVIGGGVWMKNTLKSINTLIELKHLIGEKIEVTHEVIKIDANCPLRQLEIHPVIKDLYDGIISQSIEKIMGVSIRNVATIGGTVVGKYAFSDLLAALLAVDVTLVFFKQGRMELSKYLESHEKNRDILISIEIPIKKGTGYFHKVSTTHLDFAILNLAITQIDHQFRIVIGARPGIASCANQAMELINHAKEIDDTLINEVAECCVKELSFGSNFRGSEEYRMTLAKVYVARGLWEVIHHAS